VGGQEEERISWEKEERDLGENKKMCGEGFKRLRARREFRKKKRTGRNRSDDYYQANSYSLKKD